MSCVILWTVVRSIKISWCIWACITRLILRVVTLINAINTPNDNNIAVKVKQISLIFSSTCYCCWKNWDCTLVACCVTAANTCWKLLAKWICWFYIHGYLVNQFSDVKCVLVKEDVRTILLYNIRTRAVSRMIVIEVKNHWQSLECHTSKDNLGLIYLLY